MQETGLSPTLGSPARSSPGGFHERAWGTRSPGWHVDKVPLPRITPNRPSQGDLALWVGNRSLKRVTSGHRSMDAPVMPATARPVLGSSSQAAVSKAIYQAGQPPPSSGPPARSPRGIRRRCRLLRHLLAQLHPLLRRRHKASSAGPPPSKDGGRAEGVGGLSLGQKPGPPTCRCRVGSQQTWVSSTLSAWLSPPILLLSSSLGALPGQVDREGAFQKHPLGRGSEHREAGTVAGGLGPGHPCSRGQ